MKDLVCNNFNRLMAASELSKREVAKRIKVNENTLQRWKNKESYPELPNIEELAKVLKVSPLEFYKAKEEQEPLRLPVSEMLKRLLAIPDEVYNLAKNVPLNDKKTWEQVETVLRNAGLRNKENKSTRLNES